MIRYPAIFSSLIALFCSSGGTSKLSGIKPFDCWKNWHEKCDYAMRHDQEFRTSVDERGYTALNVSIYTKNLRVFEELISLGVDLNLRKRYGDTPLIIAINLGHNDMAKRLIELGADIKARPIDDLSAFEYAIRNGNLEIVKLLLQRNANRQYVSVWKSKPIAHAIRGRNAEIMRLLLPDATLEERRELVFSAIFDNNVPVMDILLDSLDSVDFFDKDGFTPIMRAVDGPYPTLVSKILTRRPDLTLSKSSGTTVFSLLNSRSRSKFLADALKSAQALRIKNPNDCCVIDDINGLIEQLSEADKGYDSAAKLIQVYTKTWSQK